jgi:hypothetical protein
MNVRRGPIHAVSRAVVQVSVYRQVAGGDAALLATFAQFERRLISQRIREALAVKKASGGSRRTPAEAVAGGGSPHSAPACARRLAAEDCGRLERLRRRHGVGRCEMVRGDCAASSSPNVVRSRAAGRPSASDRRWLAGPGLPGFSVPGCSVCIPPTFALGAVVGGNRRGREPC